MREIDHVLIQTYLYLKEKKCILQRGNILSPASMFQINTVYLQSTKSKQGTYFPI
jgi:hypothetical protein